MSLSDPCAIPDRYMPISLVESLTSLLNPTRG